MLYKVTAGLEEALVLLEAGGWTRQPSEVASRQNICGSNMNLKKIFEVKVEEAFPSIHRSPEYAVKEKGNTHKIPS